MTGYSFTKQDALTPNVGKEAVCLEGESVALTVGVKWEGRGRAIYGE